jgi:hypothetical protein
MSDAFTPHQLEAYLEEALPADEMARIERASRENPVVAGPLAAVNARRDGGIHSLGEIWRRHRLSCPSREQLGGFLLGTLPRDPADYVAFHVETVGCRCCEANLTDLRRQHAEAADTVQTRRKRYFQSSAGYLRSPRS